MTSSTEPTMAVDEAHPARPLPEIWDSIDTALASRNMRQIWVMGTLMKFTVARNYAYGELVSFDDDNQPVCSLHIGMWRRTLARIEAQLLSAGASLEEGMELRMGGVLEGDRKFGKLRLLVDAVDHRMEVSSQVVSRQALLDELVRTGLFDRQRGLGVRELPLRIGLISSPNSAGRSDLLQTLSAGGHPAQVIEAHAPMSGPNVRAAVPEALARLVAESVEVIIVARGGGAQADLVVWDGREVAVAIASCSVPVWTALGHSTDSLVADEVAHRRWVTPTAVGEALVAAHTKLTTEFGQAQRLAASYEAAQAEIDRRQRATNVAVIAALVLALVVVILVLIVAGVA